MHRATDVKKEVARSVSLGGTGTLFSIKSAKSTAILPEERLASEVQALLNDTAGVIECATGGHGRCANSACGWSGMGTVGCSSLNSPSGDALTASGARLTTVNGTVWPHLPVEPRN